MGSSPPSWASDSTNSDQVWARFDQVWARFGQVWGPVRPSLGARISTAWARVRPVLCTLTSTETGGSSSSKSGARVHPSPGLESDQVRGSARPNPGLELDQIWARFAHAWVLADLATRRPSSAKLGGGLRRKLVRAAGAKFGAGSADFGPSCTPPGLFRNDAQPTNAMLLSRRPGAWALQFLGMFARIGPSLVDVAKISPNPDQAQTSRQGGLNPPRLGDCGPKLLS